MKCPNCDEVLVMSERQGVEIDYCPRCRGVWLDKGELDKIIEKSSAYESGSNPTSDPFYEHRDKDRPAGYNKHNPYGHRKKKGFLGDLFDFD
jgi:Zn-finger nucleic acid-binding protein